MPITPAAIVGENIRALLARRRLSQAKLGESLGMTQAMVSKRLLGGTPIDVNELVQFADYFRVPISQLLPDDVLAEIAIRETEAAS